MRTIPTIAWVTLLIAAIQAAPAWVPTDNPNTPIGTARGIHPGRVVFVHDTAATSWNGDTAGHHWWDAGNINQRVVDSMFSHTVRWLTGASTDSSAWDQLFRSYNQTHGRGNSGYQAGEKIAVKMNCNQTRNPNRTWSDNSQNPSPPVVYALLRHLITIAKVPQANITIGDPSRFIGTPLYDYLHTDFPNVHYVDQTGGSGREKAVADTLHAIHFSNDTVKYKDSTFIASCFTGANYLINYGLLRGHNLACITVCAKNHFGSLWKKGMAATSGGWSPAGSDPMIHLHGFISPIDFSKWGWVFPQRPKGTYNPLVDLMGHKDLGEKTILFFADGLYGALHQSSVNVFKWRSAPFGTQSQPDWSSCMLASQDGVALESVALDFIRSEPTYADSDIVHGTADNYLHEAAQANSPPSGTVYDPEGDGSRLTSLGAHEHWNNATSRQYSRNLGTGNGIELVSAQPTSAQPRKIKGRTGMSITNERNGMLAFQAAHIMAPATIALYGMTGKMVWSADLSAANNFMARWAPVVTGGLVAVLRDAFGSVTKQEIVVR